MFIYFFLKFVETSKTVFRWIIVQDDKQEVHGPHRSPEKTVQINKHIRLYHNVDQEKKKNIITFMRNYTNLNPLHPRMLCAMFGWNWPSVSGEKEFLISSMNFHYFVIISPLKRTGSFIWTNLNPLHPRMLCAKFGWKWSCGSGEEDF
mgnify:CR=1 FL=1